MDTLVYLVNNPWVILLVVVWSVIWKGLALWRAARLSQRAWFVGILIINTLGILEIIYLLVTNHGVKESQV